jgi:hypothetical protein
MTTYRMNLNLSDREASVVQHALLMFILDCKINENNNEIEYAKNILNKLYSDLEQTSGNNFDELRFQDWLKNKEGLIEIISESKIDEIEEVKKLNNNYKMGKGFIVEVSNISNVIQEVKLFSGNLSNGILVNTIANQFDFEGLKMEAQANPFIGNTLTTESDESIQIEIIQNKVSENIILKQRYEGSNIVIDGQDNYIKIKCPPNAKFYIRLNRLPTERINNLK